MDNKESFRHFLRDTSKLSVTSINRYVSAVETISTETVQYINKSINLYDITNFIEATKVIEEINLSDKFIQKNIKGQRMYGVGLKWYLKYLEVNKIIDFIAWNDANGVYKVKDRVSHEFPCISYEEAVNFFFSILNDDIYYEKVDNIFELPYEEVIQIAKENNIYEDTMRKLDTLMKSEKINEEFYNQLID